MVARWADDFCLVCAAGAAVGTWAIGCWLITKVWDLIWPRDDSA